MSLKLKDAVAVPGWFFFGTTPATNAMMLPGGMVPTAGKFFMVPPGWIIIGLTPPL